MSRHRPSARGPARRGDPARADRLVPEIEGGRFDVSM